MEKGVQYMRYIWNSGASAPRLSWRSSFSHPSACGEKKVFFHLRTSHVFMIPIHISMDGKEGGFVYLFSWVHNSAALQSECCGCPKPLGCTWLHRWRLSPGAICIISQIRFVFIREIMYPVVHWESLQFIRVDFRWNRVFAHCERLIEKVELIEAVAGEVNRINCCFKKKLWIW